MARRKPLPAISVVFPATLSADSFEDAIKPLKRVSSQADITFDYSAVTFAPLDVHVSAMLFFNDICRAGHEVTLYWGASTTAVFKYVERMGFFRLLGGDVVVKPARPRRGTSLYERHRRNNTMLLEMSSVDVHDRTTANSTLTNLRASLESNLDSFGAAKQRKIVDDLWTFSAEVIGNIYEHSETPVPGVVAAQRYGGDRPRLHLVIADSGLGIPATIRAGRPTEAKDKSDADIIFAAFRKGLSRNRAEVGRGCGLTRCATIAMRYQANLRVRAGTSWTKLITKSAKTGITLGIYDDKAMSIAGTHVSFDFYLDRLEGVA